MLFNSTLTLIYLILIAGFLAEPEAVADAGFGEEVAGWGGVGFEFVAQVAHVDAQVVAAFGVAGAPDGAQELRGSHHAAGVADQDGEQAVFGRR